MVAADNKCSMRHKEQQHGSRWGELPAEPGLYPPLLGMVNSTPGKISHPLEFVAFTPPLPLEGWTQTIVKSHKTKACSCVCVCAICKLLQQMRFWAGNAFQGELIALPQTPLLGLRGSTSKGRGGSLLLRGWETERPIWQWHATTLKKNSWIKTDLSHWALCPKPEVSPEDVYRSEAERCWCKKFGMVS